MDDVIVVLYEPQDDINIGTVVRACGNYGVRNIRLVRPATADPARVLISAPNAPEAVAALERYETLDEALRDCVRVFGATSRARKAARVVMDPTQVASATLSPSGNIALLFGREDHGLPNEALDRCDVEVMIPTAPDYRSLNLGQAVLIHLWEIFRARELGHDPMPVTELVRTEFEAVERAQLERLFETAETAIARTGFFKYGDGEHVMRSVRSVFNRAQLDRREVAIWFGVFKEILSFADRRPEP